jgi:hypothetical protein
MRIRWRRSVSAWRRRRTAQEAKDAGYEILHAGLVSDGAHHTLHPHGHDGGPAHAHGESGEHGE